MRFDKRLCGFLLGPIFAAAVVPAAAQSTREASGKIGGIRPDVSTLFVDAGSGYAQMGLTNTEDRPLLLKTEVVDVPESGNGTQLLTLSPIARVEAGKRQIVRFVLAGDKDKIAVQQYKRVTFEGIPPQDKVSGNTARVRLNLRYDLPVIISPPGLAKNESPWELLQLKKLGRSITITNPSPYVVRLDAKVAIGDTGRHVNAFGRTFVLPGDTFTFDLPADVDPGSIAHIRLFPASAYGAAVEPFDAKLS